MPDIQPLNYNPMQTGLQAMQLLQMQQHLGLAASAQAMQQQNLAVDNARQAYQTANPMESYPAYANYAKLSGLPVPDVNSYYANPNMYDKLLNAEPGTDEHIQAMTDWIKTNPASRAVVEKEVNNLRAFRGAQELNTAAKLGGSENLAALTQQSGPMQSAITGSLAQSPKQAAEAQALQQKIDAHDQLAANVNTQLGVLIPATKAAGLAIERTTPHVEQLDAIQQQYDKNVKSLGITKAAGMRQEQIAANPDLAAFNNRRQQSIPQIQQTVQQLEDARNQLETHAEMVARGAEPLAQGESLAILAGKVDASTHQLAYQKAMLAFAKDPSKANLDAIQTVKNGMDQAVSNLSEAKNTSQQQVDIHRNAQVETARKNAFGEAQDAATAQGQRLFAAMPTAQQTPQAAAQIAGQIKAKTGKDVATEDILKGIKMPNSPLVNIDMKQEGKERQVVGEGLGQQYLETQKAGRAAMGTLNRLDRMDQLLTGMTTGKLTPAITDVQAVGEALGIKVDPTLPAKQAFTALANEMALQLRNPSGGAGMPGSLSDKDLAFLKSMTPSLSQTPEGNRLIIDSARQVAKRDQQVAKMARDYRKANGSLDEGFYETVQNYADAHPLFAGKTVPGAAASGPSRITNDADYNALPSGSTFIGPDGKQRKKP